MKSKTPLIVLSSTLGLFASANAAVVYQDTFDDGDLATNPGIGGGLSQFVTGAGFSETGGSIVGDSSTNNNRAYVFSTNTFDLSSGFILNFITNSTGVGSNSANRFSVGIAEDAADFEAFTTAGRNYLGDGRALFEGFGVDITTDNGSQGLSHNDGTNGAGGGVGITALDNSQTISANTELDVTLTVQSNGDYTYVINGGTAATGSVAGLLDLSKEYHFASYFQDDVATHSIREVTLTTIPEPSSAVLLGLGGLALILRRRK